ncbi:MAG: hypothetical protein IKS41_01245 [Alphaproteobacteria bacterium]|nr:hypothetical protein [Alphaproteobacteria bacterium]
MKRWVVWLLCLIGTFGTCLMMFTLKYHVIEKEDELKAIHRKIIEDSRAIHMLEAEWAVENHPKRLMELVKNQTHLVPIMADQIQEVQDLPEKQVNEEVKP